MEHRFQFAFQKLGIDFMPGIAIERRMLVIRAVPVARSRSRRDVTGSPQGISTLWPQRRALSRRGLYPRPRAGPALILRARWAQVGGRGSSSARFRTRTQPLSGSEQPGNSLGKSHFSVRNRHFRSKFIFRYWHAILTTATHGGRPPSQAVDGPAGGRRAS